MGQEETALNLIGLIYDSAEQPEMWPLFLRKVAEALRSSVASIANHDRVSLQGTLSVVHGADPETISDYDNKFGADNIYVKRASGRLLPGIVIHSGMLCTDQEVLRTAYYADFLRPHDWFYLAGGAVAMDDELASLFSVSRPRRKGQFNERDLALLRVLMPHLERASRIHQRLHTLKSGVQALDSLSVGVLVVSASGKLRLANECARGILGQNDGLSLSRNSVLAATTLQNKRLTALITKAAETGNGRGFHAGGNLSIQRPSGKRPYHLVVSPTHSKVLAASWEKPAAIIFVTDPEAHHQAPAQTLISLYGLTQAEAQVALILSQGKSLQQACDELTIQYTTARTHLRAIFGKLGVRRQSELVSLLLRTLGAVRASQPSQ